MNSGDNTSNKMAQLLLAALLLTTCCIGLALGSPFNHNAAAQAGEQDDEPTGELSAMMMNNANKRGDETGSYEAQDTDLNDFGGSFKGAASGYDQQDQADVGPQQLNDNTSNNNFQQRRQGQQHQPHHSHHQAEASENSETNDDDDESSDADEDSSAPAGEAVTLETAGATGSRRNAMAIARALAESNQAQPWLEGSGSQAHQLGSPATTADEADYEQAAGPFGSDSNIANAKIELSPQDKATAAGHHHHHGHYVHGWLKMGAETGKKGAFKWHDKHPVGGKGRR